MRKFYSLIAIVPVCAAMVFGATFSASGQRDRADTFRQLELFGDVLARIHSDYVTDVNDKELIEAAINGMLASLDPHSSYLNAENYKDMQVQTKGEYGGLGIEVTMDENDIVTVVSPIDDTPASRQGIEAGDKLIAIDGDSIIGLTLNDAVSRMRGDVGEPITVTVKREKTTPFDVTIVREIITVKSVEFEFDGDIGFVRIKTFNEKTGEATKQALRTIKAQASPQLRGIVLDLRNNPGGLLDQAIEVADAFLDGGEVTHTRGRAQADLERYNARSGEILPDVPVVVMINGGSASASEIVAGALKDRERAFILGTTSFGKGSVQTVIPLKGGRQGALRLTTARYYTPSGTSIQAKGIEPDIEVYARRKEGEDDPVRFSEADLPNALDSDGAEGAEGEMNAEEIVTRDEPPADFDEDGDWQRKRAIDILRSTASTSAYLSREG